MAAPLPVPMVSEEGDQETTRVPREGNVTPGGTSPLAELLQGAAAAHDEIIPQQLQLLPAAQDPPHPLHVLVEALVDQLQVYQRLVSDLCEELQGLLAHLGHRERGKVDTDQGAAPERAQREVWSGHFQPRECPEGPSGSRCWSVSLLPAGTQPRTHPSFGQIPVVDEAGGDHGLVVPVAAVAVVEPGEGAELGPGEGEADLPGAACGSRE